MNWLALACSANGSRIIAAVKNGPIYTSTNSGAFWVSNTIPSLTWAGVSSSADGGKLVAVSGGYYLGRAPLYTLQYVISPSLLASSTGSNLTVSWIKPSTNFVLQVSSDLQNWSSITNNPTLNLSNLQNQVILATTNNVGFYRLMGP